MASKPKFVGTLTLLPAGCEATGKCTLGADFGFVDSAGTGWQAAKGNTTDGASIPGWAQPLVGLPFDKAFIRAAVIHDHYCDRHVRTWRETHRVFHEALLASGVDAVKAKIMYSAVYLGGPRWRDTIKGYYCPVGKVCVAEVQPPPPDGLLVYETEDDRDVIARPPTYGTAQFDTAMDPLRSALEADPQMDLDAIDTLADAEAPDPMFDGTSEYVPGQFGS
jgi:hypothetical protein